MRRIAFGVLILLVPVAVFAQRGRPGTGDTTEYTVPWRYLEPGVVPSAEPLVIDWFPASRREIEHSELLISRTLTDYAGQCVGMQVILPEDRQRLAKFEVAGKTPLVLLVNGDGTVVRRIEPERGALRVDTVEKALEDELNARGAVIVQQLAEARRKAAGGDRGAAIDLYQKVWAQRCLFPFAAHESQRALAALGAPPSQ